MNKAVLTILLILGITVFSLYFLFSNNASTQTKPSPQPATQNINNLNNSNTEFKKEVSALEKPDMNLQENTDYQAILSTDKGNITIDLFETKTPITVNNFVYLAQQGFYNNTIFHRVIDGFMIQGGDPTGTGTGSPGYRFDDEPFDGEYEKGTVAMANSGPNTNGSQFFIMHADYNLPKNYVIFGKVTEGMDVIDAIATAEVSMSTSGEMSKPVEPVTIQSVEIIEK